jgi:hypothetical protein
MTPEEAFQYCRLKKRRMPELESIISTDSYYSYCYARDVIKGRFEECEKSIANDSELSYWYACHVINGPFYLCHHKIFNSSFKDGYIDFLKCLNYDLNEISEWLL